MPRKRPIPIESTRHADKRVNTPTEELRDFVAEDEARPQTMRYPRDPSLDPQLVWKGKDEQDAADLAVPVVPIYIQEKIHPQALVEDLRAEAKRAQPEVQLSLFADFNGLPDDFSERVDFYRYEGNWSNRMILGDSLLVMTSLAEKEGLKGQVQRVYLDPPYGIKFGSNWQVSTRRRDVKDGKAEDLTRQPEQVRAFRDTWKLGTHSYLAYLRDRFTVARELLADSGSLFVQISNDNVHVVRCVLDEVFGAGNAAGMVAFRKTAGLTSGLLAQNADFLLWYAKGIEHVKFRGLYGDKGLDSDLGFYSYVEHEDGARERVGGREPGEALARGSRPYSVGDLTSSHFYAEGTGAFPHQGKGYSPAPRYWTTSTAGMHRLAAADRIHVSTNSLRYVRFLDDFPVQPITANWTDTITGQYSDPKLYVVQTGTKVIERCLLMTTDPGDLVLDPTCGSGTTAYVAEQWGRRWITVDTSRVALALARTRLMAGRERPPSTTPEAGSRVRASSQTGIGIISPRCTGGRAAAGCTWTAAVKRPGTACR